MHNKKPFIKSETNLSPFCAVALNTIGANRGCYFVQQNLWCARFITFYVTIVWNVTRIFHHYAASCCVKCMIIKNCICASGSKRGSCLHSVFAQRLTCPHSTVVYAQCAFFLLCTVWTCTQGNDPVPLHLCLGCRLGLQRGADCWTPAYEWVPPPAKSCQSDGERVHHSVWTESCYKWRGHLRRKTGWQTTERKTREWQANTNGRQAEHILDFCVRG